MNEITKRFYQDFCSCPEWESHHKTSKGMEFINTTMKYKPNICPFCSAPLQQRLEYTSILLHSDNSDTWITLKELKELLNECESPNSDDDGGLCHKVPTSQYRRRGPHGNAPIGPHRHS